MCYVFPVSGALITSFIWRRNKQQKVWWLNLMFYGGALFGFIDHLWNGELFASQNLAKDLLLGVVISLSIIAAWLVILALSRINPALFRYAEVKAGKI